MKKYLLIVLKKNENSMQKRKKSRLGLLVFWLSALADLILCVLNIWGEKWTSKGEKEKK
jgi:hypothetical protein